MARNRPTCSPATGNHRAARGAGGIAAAWRGIISARRVACSTTWRREVAPALLPVALVRPALDRMERRSYQPFSPSELPQWRRQWVLWRAARSGLRKAF